MLKKQMDMEISSTSINASLRTHDNAFFRRAKRGQSMALKKSLVSYNAIKKNTTLASFDEDDPAP
jgi:hypothetical protein